MLKTHIILGALLFAVTVPVMAEQNVSSLVADLDAQYDKVWNTLNAQQLSTQFTNDAIVVPASAPAETGPNAVVSFFGSLFKNKLSGHKLDPISAEQVSDNTIVATAHWSANLTDASGKATRLHGDVAQVFEKVDGAWKLKLLSFNMLPNT